jgi:hypothetical protein
MAYGLKELMLGILGYVGDQFVVNTTEARPTPLK